MIFKIFKNALLRKVLKRKNGLQVFLLLSIVVLCSFVIYQQQKPTLYIIGDSTVRNTNGEQVGWGSLLYRFFDTTCISMANYAMAGRSSRSFTNEGRWAKVDSLLKKGDYVMMQFGHNDGSYPDTTAKNRGTLKGIGEETVELVFSNGRKETVHTYGWYIRQFVRQTKAKGATPVVLSIIPRNIFREGKVVRASADFGRWAKEVAAEEGALFIDLNTVTADKYDALGPEGVKGYFSGDHTHTNREGALINAASVAEGVKALHRSSLSRYVLKQ